MDRRKIQGVRSPYAHSSSSTFYFPTPKGTRCRACRRRPEVCRQTSRTGASAGSTSNQQIRTVPTYKRITRSTASRDRLPSSTSTTESPKTTSSSSAWVFPCKGRLSSLGTTTRARYQAQGCSRTRRRWLPDYSDPHETDLSQGGDIPCRGPIAPPDGVQARQRRGHALLSW